jgi:hypothetical protein
MNREQATLIREQSRRTGQLSIASNQIVNLPMGKWLKERENPYEMWSLTSRFILPTLSPKDQQHRPT